MGDSLIHKYSLYNKYNMRKRAYYIILSIVSVCLSVVLYFIFTIGLFIVNSSSNEFYIILMRIMPFTPLVFPFLIFILTKEALNRFSFMCEHCLKTIEIKKLSVKCPFCDDDSYILKGSVFKLHSCSSYIQKISCYHCGGPINLLAEYNGVELEAKRYE